MALPIVHPHPITSSGVIYDMLSVTLAMNTQPMGGETAALRSAVILTPYRIGSNGTELLSSEQSVVSIADAAEASNSNTPIGRLASAITTAIQAYADEVL